MKVAFIAPANSVHTQKWVNALSDRDNEIHLFSLINHYDYFHNFHKNVKITYLKMKSPLGYFFCAGKLRKFILNDNFDIINVHYASGYGTLVRLAKLDNVLLNVWGSDVYDFPYKSRFNYCLLKKNLMYADKLASTSNVMAEQVKNLLNNPKQEVAITPFGVDTKLFKKSDNIEKDKRTFTLINIKTLEPVYGIEDLVNAFFIIKNKYRGGFKLQLNIFGEGSQKDKIEHLIQSLELTDSVFLKGKIDHLMVPEVLNQADIFVSTSLRESFGVSIVEAMATELPVVATNVPGFKEVMEDNVTGYLVPINCPEELAKKILFLIDNTETRNRMGKEGRRRVMQFYSWDNNVNNLMELYNSMISKSLKEK